MLGQARPGQFRSDQARSRLNLRDAMRQLQRQSVGLIVAARFLVVVVAAVAAAAAKMAARFATLLPFRFRAWPLLPKTESK